MKKFFMAFLAVATIAMIGCKKDEPVTPTPTPGGGGEDPDIEIPEIAAPGAGKTTIAIYAEVCPKGAYLVGSFQGYNPSDDAASFVAVPDAKNWYAVTIDYAPDLQMKAIARPSDEAVPLSWDYQWGKNYDEADPGTVPEGTENTKIVKGTGNFVYENQGQPKLAEVADNGVVYVQVVNWAASPVIEAKPLETAWAKTNWDNVSDWTWKQMTAKGGGVFEVEGIWGGKGVNISATEDGANSWYDVGDANFEIQAGAKAGDKVKLTFTSEKGTIGKLKLEVTGSAADIPAGNGKFLITITNRNYTDGDVCIFTGNFEEKSWGDSDRAMTHEGSNVWSWEGAYPKNFEFKVIYNGKWANDPNGKMTDPATYEYEMSIQD
jgi:hypothetical protein